MYSAENQLLHSLEMLVVFLRTQTFKSLITFVT
jgi:hypothetical protein